MQFEKCDVRFERCDVKFERFDVMQFERCDVQFERGDAFDYQMVIVQGGNTGSSLHTFLIYMSTVITRTLATVGKQI